MFLNRTTRNKGNNRKYLLPPKGNIHFPSVVWGIDSLISSFHCTKNRIWLHLLKESSDKIFRWVSLSPFFEWYLQRKKCPYSEFFWCILSHIWTEYRGNADHKNSDYGHFSHNFTVFYDGLERLKSRATLVQSVDNFVINDVAI